ncbi:olfactory receptor 1440-like [Bufo gargarizans]|uniref:olfactory receptor 1440-like n=1 Tax=Bufo gargarizans TaxID=30331 RepID=UPI001CF51BE9|nr:olfactory receptor 1440-like [Bufo gargarizans]
MVRKENRLHSPMYFFLANISVIDIFYTTNIVPQMLATFLIKIYVISYTGCISQFFIHICLGSAECLILAIMAFDRYVAVCNPLHYLSIMNYTVCIYLIAGMWAIAITANLPPLFSVCQLHFCGRNTINHFFCDAPPLLEVSCEGSETVEFVNFVVAASMIMSSFSIIMLSYGLIIRAIIFISKTGRKKKTFSTCVSHLIVVAIFFGSLIIMYVRPNYANTAEYNKIVSVCYTMVTPMMNPVIYTFRNKDIKHSLRSHFICHDV